MKTMKFLYKKLNVGERTGKERGWVGEEGREKKERSKKRNPFELEKCGTC